MSEMGSLESFDPSDQLLRHDSGGSSSLLEMGIL